MSDISSYKTCVLNTKQIKFNNVQNNDNKK